MPEALRSPISIVKMGELLERALHSMKTCPLSYWVFEGSTGYTNNGMSVARRATSEDKNCGIGIVGVSSISY